jgi:hypothetical protein
MDDNMLQYFKNVVANTSVWNYVTFNFHQANIKWGFHNYTQNKKVQLLLNVIVEINYIFGLILND